jgi:hypothetical protein
LSASPITTQKYNMDNLDIFTTVRTSDLVQGRTAQSKSAVLMPFLNHGNSAVTTRGSVSSYCVPMRGPHNSCVLPTSCVSSLAWPAWALGHMSCSSPPPPRKNLVVRCAHKDGSKVNSSATFMKTDLAYERNVLKPFTVLFIKNNIGI